MSTPTMPSAEAPLRIPAQLRLRRLIAPQGGNDSVRWSTEAERAWRRDPATVCAWRED
jgi:hypothetical protein